MEDWQRRQNSACFCLFCQSSVCWCAVVGNVYLCWLLVCMEWAICHGNNSMMITLLLEKAMTVRQLKPAAVVNNHRICKWKPLEQNDKECYKMTTRLSGTLLYVIRSNDTSTLVAVRHLNSIRLEAALKLTVNNKPAGLLCTTWLHTAELYVTLMASYLGNNLSYTSKLK